MTLLPSKSSGNPADGGRKAGSAHVNPATGAENHDSPPPSYHSRDLESGNIASMSYLVRPSIRLT